MIVDEKVTDGDGSHPRDRGKDSALRAVSLTVGEKGVIQEIGENEEKQDKEVFL